MEQIGIGLPAVAVSRLGFGCAGLFALATRNERRSLLEAAFERSLVHFDVAPMYGLGRAEAELGDFIRGRRGDVTVTTKFGIGPTVMGQIVGRAQAPIRSLLRRRPGLGAKIKASGRSPRSGVVGRLLYRVPDYSKEMARASLDNSLRSLSTDYVDFFVLHEPEGARLEDSEPLIEYLDAECQAGRVRSWGIAGRMSNLDRSMTEVYENSGVLQFPDDIFCDQSALAVSQSVAVITFGWLSRALPIILKMCSEDESKADHWSHRLGSDVRNASNVVSLLAASALDRNSGGIVLFSTTSISHLTQMRHAAEARFDQIAADVLEDMLLTARERYPASIGRM